MAITPEEKQSEDWTGEPDAVAAIVLAICLAVSRTRARGIPSPSVDYQR
jgi:hypothetical protein